MRTVSTSVRGAPTVVGGDRTVRAFQLHRRVPQRRLRCSQWTPTWSGVILVTGARRAISSRGQLGKPRTATKKQVSMIRRRQAVWSDRPRPSALTMSPATAEDPALVVAGRRRETSGVGNPALCDRGRTGGDGDDSGSSAPPDAGWSKQVPQMHTMAQVTVHQEVAGPAGFPPTATFAGSARRAAPAFAFAEGSVGAVTFGIRPAAAVGRHGACGETHRTTHSQFALFSAA